MNPKVYLLALITFATGMDENIAGGIVPFIAEDLGVSISAAGQLTTVFSLTFALAAPVLLFATAKFNRLRLLQVALFTFCLGNLFSALSPSYAFLFGMRIISAASCALIVVLVTTIATEMVEAEFKGRAIGIIFMGISGSLVLGVPVGLLFCNWLGWRAPFAFIALMALLLCIIVPLMLPNVSSNGQRIPLSKYAEHLKNPKLLTAQLVSILMIGGHFVLFAYLAPYLQATIGASKSELTFYYFLFGAAAITGGYMGGWLSDKLGHITAIILIPSIFILFLGAIPFTLNSLVLFIPCMMLWGGLSWTISPIVQNYLIQSDHANAGVSIAVNNTSMHLGVALGSLLGGVVIKYSSVNWTPAIGVFVVVLSLLCALYSTRCQEITREECKEKLIQP
ncbi:major facilitator superfamily MFS_1 [Shewanella halifaxensis HAW-EB4]|uniref:Major facilitator superfamily MFS_1 n=1 Tax=Shewanella halifaxensis (strain HAW-EB4) TaxID=458817 RepID=B0TJI4_SHEHH|nr:MFS transporter [Shewanella halifaxensis]ABZ76980.1 major facilitator superfamily MFS_1 [Shewanella halifaxensis HAW-EB4]